MIRLPVPAEPRVTFAVSVAVGSQDDPPGKEGLAYMTSQMLVDAGTEQRALEDILDALYPLAADYGARVDRERTTLSGLAHRDTTATFLELFADAYLRPAFPESDFERIRSDAINEIENTLRYSSDEDLAKAVLYESVFRGTRYAHPPEGTVAGLRALTLDDVRAFYRRHYTRSSALPAIGGGYDEATARAFADTLNGLPAGAETAPPAVDPAPWSGREVVVVDKPGADASLSFGFPITPVRGERDFYALFVAKSWFGEHRHQASHLFQVIREIRGLNYGDYSYIEAFPDGGEHSMPPVNVPRRRQVFEVWVRTLPNHQALFALRAALRELDKLVANGMTAENFELTRAFLKKYSLHFADRTSLRLGYAIDDRFYGLEDEGHLARFRRMMDELTLDDVNGAIRRHLQTQNLRIAIVTGEPEKLRDALVADAPSPIVYETPKPDAVLAEDAVIAVYPLRVAANAVAIVPVAQAFAR
jgi:zinc protease